MPKNNDTTQTRVFQDKTRHPSNEFREHVRSFVSSRDIEIFEEYKKGGTSLAGLAKKHKISRQRVSQILARLGEKRKGRFDA